MASSRPSAAAATTGGGGGGTSTSTSSSGTKAKSPPTNMTDIEFKERGNRYFGARKYEEALQCYTQAIIKNPSDPFYYTNRALTAIRLLRFDDANADCRAALELEPNHVKAHFFLGTALCERGNLDDGIAHMQRAVDLQREQRLNFGDDVTQVLRQWRKKRFAIAEEKRLSQEVELQSYLSRLVKEDRDRQIDFLKAKSTEASGAGGEAELIRKISTIEAFSDSALTELNALFAKVDERRMKREVPDYLCGRISMDILRNPVVTPSGITYERKDIEDHLMRVGHFDPVTRVTLTADQLIPNYAMKEVVDTFIAENEWALDF
jgi:STIP1 family protein 1